MAEHFGWSIEFYGESVNGKGWVQAYPGRHWRSKVQAERAMETYRDAANADGWFPELRIIDLEHNGSFVVEASK